MQTSNPMRLSCLLIAVATLFLSNCYGQGRWDTISSVGFTQRSGSACAEVGGKIYVIGGYTIDSGGKCLSTVEVYDPLSNMWTTPKITGEFTPRYGHTANAMDGKIYVMGGYNDSSQTVCYDISVFDPTSSTWSTLLASDDYIPRVYHSSVVIDDNIYLIGGWSGSLISQIDVFDPFANIWSQATDTGDVNPRQGASSVAIGEKIYVIGGVTYNNIYQTSMDIFDLSLSTWTFPITIGRFSSSAYQTAQLLNGKIYVVGGFYVNTMVTKFKAYDPATDSIILINPVGTFTPTASATTCVVGNRMYVIGGWSRISLTSNQVYTPTNLNSIALTNEAPYLTISPNPTSGKVSMSGIPENLISISIVNVIGEQVMQLQHSTTNELTFDVSSLPIGVYYIKLTTSTSIVLRKILRTSN